MERRVSWVRSWSWVSTSGSSMSAASRATVWAPSFSVASTPALPDHEPGLVPLEAGARDGRGGGELLGAGR